MLENYPQNFINDLYEEGDRDYHFFNELFAFVGNLYPEPYMKNMRSLNKGATKQLKDVLVLIEFMMHSNDYIGVYMPEYGKPLKLFNTFDEFRIFIEESMAKDRDFLNGIDAENRYTIALKKVKLGAKAPLVTPEIENIFKV